MPTSAELYVAVSELTLRANTGEAEAVLAEIDDLLHSAREIGAQRIVQHGLYVAASCHLWLNRLKDCELTCDLLTAESSEDPIDRGWRSSSASMRAIVSLERGARTQAIEGVVEAAIHLRDAPPRGPGYLIAVNGLGIIGLSLRLYELSLGEFARVEKDPVLSEHRVSALFAALNTQLAHIYWGLELERVGSAATARTHFEDALEHGRRSRNHLPEHDPSTWQLVLQARSGLCLAFLGEVDLAVPRLEAAIELLADRPLEETIMASIGLARASASVDHRVARAHAEHALSAVGPATDYALAMAASWERARLDLDDPATAGALSYCHRIARESWEERDQLVDGVAQRVEAAVAIRRARQSDRLLFDEETGLPNRLLLTQQLMIHVADAGRTAGVLSLAFLDLAERAPAKVLAAIIATLDVDLLARSHHSELAAVGVGLSADELADRIRACGADALSHLTVGVAALVAPSSVTTLVAHADEALLTAQRRGGIWINPCASSC